MRQPRLAPAQDDPTAQIAEYVCGLLKAEERAQVHILLSRDDQALAQALAWEEELLALVDALPRTQPSPALRQRLQRTLGIGPPPAFQPPPQPQLLRRPSREPGAVAQTDARKAAAASTVGALDRPATKTLNGKSGDAHAGPTPKTTASAPSSTPVPGESDAQKTADMNGAARPVEKPRSGAQQRASGTAGHIAAPPAAPSPSGQESMPAPASSPRTKDRREPSGDAGTGAGQPDDRHRALLRKLWFWRLIGVCAASAAIVGFMLPGEPPPPPVQIVKVAPTRAAILQAPGTSSTPGWTATLGPEGSLTMHPLVHTEVPTGSQVLLWTRSEQIPEPRLLGRIDPNQPVQVPAAQLGALSDDQILEITLETDEDAAKAVPNGPILFIGQMTVFGAEGAAGPAAADAASASASGGPITQGSATR